MSEVTTKKCKDCEQVKHVSNFRRVRRSHKFYFIPYCNPCHNSRAKTSRLKNPDRERVRLRLKRKRWRTVNPEKARELGRKNMSKARYGEFWEVHRKFLEIKRMLKTKGEVK